MRIVNADTEDRRHSVVLIAETAADEAILAAFERILRRTRGELAARLEEMPAEEGFPSNLPSKLAVARMSSIPDAVQATEWLWAQCRVAWLEEDVDKSKLTAEVLQWIES